MMQFYQFSSYICFRSVSFAEKKLKSLSGMPPSCDEAQRPVTRTLLHSNINRSIMAEMVDQLLDVAKQISSCIPLLYYLKVDFNVIL